MPLSAAAPPAAAATAIACMVLAVGFTLLFFGARLSRFGFVLGAVAGAGLLATASCRALGLPEWHGWLWSTAAAGAACLLTSFLFRLWMGVTGMLFMAVLVAAIVVIWQGPPLPAFHAPGRGHGQVWEHNFEALRLWWSAKSDAGRQTLRLASLIGAILGLGLGLAVPLRAAALQCAIAGAGLCLIAGRALLELHAQKQAAWLPDTPRAILLVLLAVAAVGFAAQGGGGEPEDPGKGADWSDKKKSAK